MKMTPIKAFEEQTRRNMEMFQNAMRLFTPFPAQRVTRKKPNRPSPSRRPRRRPRGSEGTDRRHAEEDRLARLTGPDGATSLPRSRPCAGLTTHQKTVVASMTIIWPPPWVFGAGRTVWPRRSATRHVVGRPSSASSTPSSSSSQNSRGCDRSPPADPCRGRGCSTHMGVAHRLVGADQSHHPERG